MKKFFLAIETNPKLNVYAIPCITCLKAVSIENAIKGLRKKNLIQHNYNGYHIIMNK